MSKHINTPTLSTIQDHDDNSSTFVIEPLHNGYGMTLGNSIRRVLLSSISGAAITSFKVEGATHEFTTIAGIKEDVVNISQNLKGVILKVYSDEPQTLRIVKKGKGTVTASNIETNADVEIVNPTHVIATIDDDKAEFVADIIIETGRGYQTIDTSAANKPSDHIALDAVFSPVLRVRYKVESTRVGRVTDLDKLSITVDTDGSINPKDAFEEANAILVNQYTALAGQTTVEAPAPLTDGPLSEADQDEDAPALMTPIEDLNLSARTSNALVNNDIHTLKDLFALSDTELRELKGFGSKALDEVKDKMAELEI